MSDKASINIDDKCGLVRVSRGKFHTTLAVADALTLCDLLPPHREALLAAHIADLRNRVNYLDGELSPLLAELRKLTAAEKQP